MRDRKRFAITFRVDEHWKGSVRGHIVIHGLDDSTDCMGVSSLEVGKNYLVFATERPSEDVYLLFPSKLLWYGWTDVIPKGTPVFMLTACAPTGEASQRFAKEALQRLGKGEVPSPRAVK